MEEGGSDTFWLAGSRKNPDPLLQLKMPKERKRKNSLFIIDPRFCPRIKQGLCQSLEDEEEMGNKGNSKEPRFTTF